MEIFNKKDRVFFQFRNYSPIFFFLGEKAQFVSKFPGSCALNNILWLNVQN